MSFAFLSSVLPLALALLQAGTTAALLLVGAALAASPAPRTLLLRRLTPLLSLLLVGTALWLPGHSGSSAGQEMRLLGWLFAAGLAAVARPAASRELPLHLRAGAALGSIALAAGFALLATPGLLELGSIVGVLGGGLLVLLLAAGVVALHWPRGDERRAWWMRAAIASACAGLLLAGEIAEHNGLGGGPRLSLLIALLPLGTGLALVVLLRESAKAAPASAAREKVLLSNAPPLDALTQLPTRVFFEDRLAAAVAKCDASKGRLALLFIDLDGFKPVNDSFGHSNGDRVLQQVGQRLKSLSRHADVVARVGGDEFLLLVGGNPTQEVVAQVATRLLEGLSRPYQIEDREVAISCSVGIVFYPDSGAHTKLIARADAAMYSAKRSGGSCYCFYSPAMDADSREKFDMLRELRGALERNELELYFQPKIDAASGKITAAEALLRWRHPTRGVVLPGEFIPVAERFGLIGALGNWVIEDACRQARVWRDKGLRMRVAINLSAQQMRQDDIVDRLQNALEKHRIDPSLLTCEITETVAMEDTKATQTTFQRLGAAGIHLSIDDFGTGYSSLSYLRRLPAEELKIDRSFVMDIDHSPDARAVVDAVVKLAHALGLRVVAEGVETPRQQQLLVQMGCDELQGYLFAKPMSARALLLWAMDDQKTDYAAFRESLFGATVAQQNNPG